MLRGCYCPLCGHYNENDIDGGGGGGSANDG